MKNARILAGILIALVAVPALAQQKSVTRMYKCVDGAGKVYYSDSPRDDCNKGTQMNRHGVEVTGKPGEKAVRTGPTISKAAKAEPATGARRDRALLATYTSEEEIDAARDRSLAMPLQAVKTLEGKNAKVEAELFELKKQADGIAAQQKALPQYLIEDVQAKQKQQATLEADLVKKKGEADAIRARFEADKVRFRELKGTAAAPTATAKN